MIGTMDWKSVTAGKLVSTVEKYKKDGYRVVQINCIQNAEGLVEVNYSFAKEFDFVNLRIITAPGSEVPSITGIYPGVFAYENEIKELWDIRVQGILIDFQNTFYRKVKDHPFLREEQPAKEAE
jgi:ech hydrogenase subunit D